LPAGNTRTTTYYAPFPIALARGDGYRVWDLDGNEYVDLLNNYTALVHGHAAPAISAAIERVLREGTVFPAPIPLQAELAERICRHFASIELVRFTNSGTEAVMMAVRAARAFTGRDLIVTAYGGYHGSWEQVAYSASEESARAETTIEQDARGIPAAVRDLNLQVRYNDVTHLRTVMGARGGEVAAIVLEPVLGHVIEPATSEFLAAAEDLATTYGALFVLDEIITARLHTGGLQSEMGRRPHLTTLGKVIGGGLPVGAFGGRADVMAVFDPRLEGSIAHHGTFNGNALTMAAGCASLDLLPQSEIDRINNLGAALEANLAEAFSDVGLAVRISRAGSILNLHSPHLPELHATGLQHGVYFAPRGQMCTSTAMDDSVIERVSESMRQAAVAVMHDVVGPRGDTRKRDSSDPASLTTLR
jgi:glutamate-1-semialdehyde 2,1-aminomutase